MILWVCCWQIGYICPLCTWYQSFVDKVCLCQRAHGSGAVTTGRLGQFGLRPPLLQQVGCVYLVVCLLYFVVFGCTCIVVFGRQRHVVLSFNRGSLPWQGRAVRAETTRQKHDKILERKTSITEEELCKGLPMEFILYLNYCKSLGFYERPDYQYLRHLFKDLFQRLRYEYDSKYDWTVLKEKGVTRKDCEQRVRSRDDVF